MSNRLQWDLTRRHPFPVVDSALQSVSRAVQPMFDNATAELRASVDRLLAGVDWQQIRETLDRAVRGVFPVNWEVLTIDEVARAIDLGAEDGINVVWVPSAPVIRDLIAAPDRRARAIVLEHRRHEILADVAATLGQVRHPALARNVELASEARAAMQEDRDAASQALASAVLSGVVTENFGHRYFRDAREAWEAMSPSESELPLLRLATVLSAFARALQHTDDAPPGFNRHATLHGHTSQFTAANAMAALMLVTGVLRELDASLQMLDEHRDAA